MFELKQYSDVLVMGVSGEINLQNVRQFDTVLTNALQEDVSRVVLDLTHLQHIDYKLVSHLVDRIIEIQCQGGEVKLASGNAYVSNILKAMGFEEELYQTVEDAVISFTPMTEEEWH